MLVQIQLSRHHSTSERSASTSMLLNDEPNTATYWSFGQSKGGVHHSLEFVCCTIEGMEMGMEFTLSRPQIINGPHLDVTKLCITLCQNCHR